jgi:quercetin dioxygenase-like cupin family protein
MRHALLLPFAFIGLSLGCAEAPEPAPTDYPDAITADPDHYSVEYENDAVRIVRIAYGAGEESIMHTHPASCSVSLSDGSWSMADPDGGVTEEPTAVGEVQCFDAVVHLPTNTSSEASEVILVELKEGASAGSATADYPDAVTADPGHYAVEWENDVIRMIRISYGPGETSTMHHHAANCAIFLGAQTITFELPDGEVQEPPATELGQVECFDAHDHLPTNASDEPLELVLLELKGRATLE